MAKGFFLFELVVEVEAGKANNAVLFYKAALGAEEVHRNCKNPYPITFEDEHPLTIVAELKIDGGLSFLVAHRTHGIVKVGEREMDCQIVTEDVEGKIAKMVEAGAVEDGQEVDCCGRKVWRVKDPYGYVWKFRNLENDSPMWQLARMQLEILF